MDLKQIGIDMIKRTYDLSQSLTNISTASRNTTNLDSTSEDLDALYAKLDVISNRILTNKQNSDKLNIIADEIGSVLNQFGQTKSNLSILDSSFKQFEDNLTQLQFTFDIQRGIIDDLVKQMVKFRLEQKSIQEDVPRGAYRLIKQYGSDSDRYMALSHKVRQALLFNESANQTFAGVKARLSDARRAEALSTETIKQLLNESMIRDKLFNDGHFLRVVADYLSPGIVLSKTRPDNDIEFLHEKKDVARMLAADITPMAELYISNASLRIAELKSINESYLGSQISLNEAGLTFEQFSSNLTSLVQKISQFNNTKRYDFAKAIEDSVGMTRVRLDRVDAKLTMAQAEMAELERLTSGGNVADKISELSNEINSTLDNLMPHLTSFADNIKTEITFGELSTLRSKTISLMDIASQMNDKLADAVKIRRSTDKVCLLTNATNQETQDVITQVIKTISDEVNSIAPSDITSENLVLDVGASGLVNLRDRLSKLNVKLLGDHSKEKRRVEIESNRLIRLKGEGVELLGSLKDSHRNVKHLLSLSSDHVKDLSVDTKLMVDTNTTLGFAQNPDAYLLKTEDLAKRLRERKRTVSLLTGFRSIAMHLYKSLGKTDGLRQEFDSNEQTFLRQHKVLQFLHQEMDRITAEIKVKLDNCQTS